MKSVLTSSFPLAIFSSSLTAVSLLVSDAQTVRVRVSTKRAHMFLLMTN